MKLAQVTGAVFLTAGIAMLAYGGFSYTKHDRKAQIGSIELVVNEKEHVGIPVWAGVVAVVAGASLLLVPGRKSKLS
jgi:hypothetical protein